MTDPLKPAQEMLRSLAEAADWNIPDERIAEMTAIYQGIIQDTRILRTADLSNVTPANIYHAE